MGEVLSQELRFSFYASNCSPAINNGNSLWLTQSEENESLSGFVLGFYVHRLDTSLISIYLDRFIPAASL